MKYIYLFLIFSQCIFSQDFKNSLIASYSFDTDVTDLIDNQNPLVRDIQAKLSKDRNGKIDSAYYFDGIKSFIKLPININPAVYPEISFVMWLKISPSDRPRVIFSNGSTKQPGRNLYVNSKYIITYINKPADPTKNNQKEFKSLSSQNIDYDKWIQVALVYNQNDSTVRIIVEDEEYQSKGIVSDANNYFVIGASSKNENSFIGSIDELNIYSKALTKEELSTLFGKTISDNSDRANSTKVRNTIIGIFAIIFYPFSILFMVYTLVFKKKSFNNITKEEIEQKGNIESFTEIYKSPEQRNSEAWELTEKAFKCWKLVSQPNEDELRSPLSKKQIKESSAFLNQAIALNPTDSELIERINYLGQFIIDAEKRVFAGSIKLIVCSVIVILFYSWLMAPGSFFENLLSAWWLWAPLLMYIMASFAPKFLVDKRSRRLGNRTGCLAGIGAFFFGLLLAEPATETYITRYSDGTSRRTQEANPFFLVLMVVTVIIAFALAAFMFIWGAIAFLRNYVLYI